MAARGGAGGIVQLSNGLLNVTGGKILLAGGAAGTAINFGAPGAVGHFDISGGTFNFSAGQITANTGVTPATPASLVQATMNISTGAMNLLNDFTNSGGTINLTGTGVINGNGANGSTGAPGGTGTAGRLITTSGTLAMSGATSQLNLNGGAGGGGAPGGAGGAGAAGGTLNVTGGATSLSGTSVLGLKGGAGGAGGFIDLLGIRNAGGAGGTGGTLAVSSGTFSIDQNAQAQLPGGNGNSAGGRGGAGGTLSVTGGAVTIAGTSVFQLTGGNGGNANSLFPIVAGGSGGTVNLSSGAINMTGGKILLAGGAPGSGSLGAAGAAGSFNLSGGSFNFTAGQITANTGVTPATPAALVQATMNIGGGSAVINAPLDLVQATVNLSAGVLNANSINRNTSAFNFTGGTLHVQTFNGTLVNNGGTLAPGTSAGTTTVNGSYTQNSGTLAIELGGTAAGQFDKLVVTGTATLGGALDVNLFGGFAPTLGQSWEIIDVAGSLSGTFAGLAQDAPFANYSGTLLTISYAGGDGNDVFINTVAGLAGDFDLDGDVDGRDFLVWQRGGSATPLSATDRSDWQANYGMTAALTVSTAAVPEPGALILLTSLAVIGSLTTRRVQNRRIDR